MPKPDLKICKNCEHEEDEDRKVAQEK